MFRHFHMATTHDMDISLNEFIVIGSDRDWIPVDCTKCTTIERCS
jgi:hypothetical protein